jgi:hypothetical protein
MKDHLEDNHELLIKTVQVRENNNAYSVIAEDLVTEKIWICDSEGYLNMDFLVIQNKCRFCGSRFNSLEKFNKHINADHPFCSADIEVRVNRDGFVVTIEELERKKISLK